MEILDAIKRMFSGKKRLDKITSDEIRRERIRLEQTEQRVGREVEDLEARKRALFAKGRDESSQRQQIALARKIKELDAAAQAKDRQSAMISRQMRILSGLQILKENTSLIKDMGVSSIVSRMDLADLQAYVDKATVEGQFQMERFAEILKTIETPEGMELAGEDSDTLAIVAAMQEAKDAEQDTPEAATEVGMKKVDEILHKKEAKEEEQDIQRT
jgi:hypothetical protein